MFTFTANLLSRMSWIAPGSDRIATASALGRESSLTLTHDSHEVVTLGRGP